MGYSQRSQLLTESAVTQLEEAVNHHTNALLKKYLWKDVLRQMIPMPGFSSVSERVQKAEQQIRWDGRITNEQRASLFSNIERLALQGRGISKINAMQSLAKIVHSLSIKDFHQFQQAGYPQETLVQVLRIKTQALRDLRMLSNRTRVQSEELEQSPATALQQSVISVVYANYLLWWLGMGTLKHSPLFWSFKLGKLALEGLFINALVESILDVIKCPNKKGFRMFFGDYEVWANDLTQDCFKEFVRQFRLISKEESFEPFLEQLSKFNLRALDSIDLRDKALTSNETREILNILKNKRASIKGLNLGRNKINDTMGLLFPNSLQFLHLWNNDLGTEGVQGLKLPDSLQFLALDDNGIGAGVQGLKLPNGLQSLSLNFNNIGAEGIQGLMLPDSLQSLDLGGNGIGDAGVHGLMLPDNLQSLYLWNNSIGAGVQGLKLPSSLQSLILSVNNIGDAGAQGLMLPDNLQSLDLRHNNLTDEGAQGLRLPGNLQSLDLSVNGIGDEGIQGLKLPNKLQSLILWENRIGDKGVQELNLPDNLQSLDLRYNNITNEGIQGLKLPTSLQSLDLGNNGIDANIQGLKLPESLQSLNLDSNDIGAEGAQRLRLPENLQSLSLGGNDIGDEGIQGLKLPGNLQSLNLVFNNIGPEGVQRLKLPENLQSLYLGYNSIGDEGAKRLKLPGGLQSLGLWNNNISDAGALGFKLPGSLQFLDLSDNAIGTEGTKGLQLPAMLQTLSLEGNNITDQGIQGLKLPDGLQVLYLSNNKIGGEGVNALLRKIPKTNLTNIDLTDNLYNVTAISSTRIIQQQILLRKCQSQLCYANIPLSQQNEYQTSAATRAEPLLFFGWLKKPFDKLAEYVDNCFSTTLDSIGTRLEKILSRSPSYFPNIRSSDIYDWQPSGSVMLHQFKAGGSNTLLLPAPQAAIRPSLGAVAR
jgi:Leucine-rich repeat (LRR) protein